MQGAAAVLEFYSIEAPLAQPRNAVLGQLIAAVSGVAVAKLFRLSPRFDDIQWVGGALACASATCLMALTNTVHPPAGATALLAVVDDSLVRLGWVLVPVMMLGCALMLGVALLVNNVAARRFPMYWWTPEELGGKGRSSKVLPPPPPPHSRAAGKLEDEEEASIDDVALPAVPPVARGPSAPPEPKVVVVAANNNNNIEHGANTTHDDNKENTNTAHVVLKPGEIVVPHGMTLSPAERYLLETISSRLTYAGVAETLA